MNDWRQQAKNSLNTRNYKETIKRFNGDPKLAAAYLPIAQTILGGVINRAMLGGIGYSARLIKLSDGTTIKVTTNSGINCIEIKTQPISYLSEFVKRIAIYMESGFIDARSFEGEFQPKNHIYETESTNNIDYLKDSLLFDKIPQSELFNDRSHAIPGGIGDKRSLVWLPLMSTGLLKRALQALLGRANPHYVVPDNEELNDYGNQSSINISTAVTIMNMAFGVGVGPAGDFSTNMTLLTHTIGRSRGLFRVDDYIYYFISIQTPNIYAYPCTFKEAGKELIRYLKAYLAGEGESGVSFSADDLLKIESYILSDISIDVNTRFLVGTIEVIGNSVFNGWHFNNNGSKADIIALEKIYNEDEIPKDLYIISRHYRISFSENVEFNSDDPISDTNSPIKLELTTIEETNCSPANNKHNLWIPLYSLGVMMYYYWCSNSIGFLAPLEEYDAPIYCYYDNGDNFIESRVYLEELELPPTIAANVFYNSVYTCADEEVSSTYYNLTSYNKSGFYVVNGEDHRLENKVGNKLYAKAKRETTSDTVISGSGGGAVYNRPIQTELCGNDQSPPPNAGGYTYTRTGVKVWGEQYAASVWTETNDYINIIPWLDTEAFYCGHTVDVTESGTHYYFYRQGIGEDDVVWTTGPYAGTTRYYRDPARSSAAGPSGGGLPVDQSSTTQTISVDSFNANLRLYYRSGSLISTEYSSLGDMGKWSALIDPILFGPEAYPFFDQPFIVNQGLLDNIIYYSDISADTWPKGFRQRNIVGLTDESLLAVYQLGIFSGWT
jgi:hypothetical protein